MSPRRGGGTADAVDSKSIVRKDVRVQIPPPAQPAVALCLSRPVGYYEGDAGTRRSATARHDAPSPGRVAGAVRVPVPRLPRSERRGVRGRGNGARRSLGRRPLPSGGDSSRRAVRRSIPQGVVGSVAGDGGRVGGRPRRACARRRSGGRLRRAGPRRGRRGERRRGVRSESPATSAFARAYGAPCRAGRSSASRCDAGGDEGSDRLEGGGGVATSRVGRAYRSDLRPSAAVRVAGYVSEKTTYRRPRLVRYKAPEDRIEEYQVNTGAVPSVKCQNRAECQGGRFASPPPWEMD